MKIGFTQGVRFTAQLGVASPIGDFSNNEGDPKNGGFATTGFDMKLVGERFFESNWVSGINLGYSLFPVDVDAIKRSVNPTNPESVGVESQSFQNINLQFRGGYNFSFLENKLAVVPFVDAGLGVFNSAYYLVSQNNTNIFLRSGNTGLGFLVSPGINLVIAMNDMIGISVYSSYQFASYDVKEQFKSLGTSTGINWTETISYPYRSMNYGLGVSLTL